MGNLPFAIRNVIQHIHKCASGSFPVTCWWCIQGEGRRETYRRLVRYYQRVISWLCRLRVLFAVISLTLEVAFRWDFEFKLKGDKLKSFHGNLFTSRVFIWTVVMCRRCHFPLSVSTNTNTLDLSRSILENNLEYREICIPNFSIMSGIIDILWVFVIVNWRLYKVSKNNLRSLLGAILDSNT